jgi:hypothetical protein
MSELYVNLERRLAQSEACAVNILNAFGESDASSVNVDALIDLYVVSERSRTRQIIWEFISANVEERAEELKMRDVGISYLVH